MSVAEWVWSLVGNLDVEMDVTFVLETSRLAGTMHNFYFTIAYFGAYFQTPINANAYVLINTHPHTIILSCFTFFLVCLQVFSLQRALIQSRVGSDFLVPVLMPFQKKIFFSRCFIVSRVTLKKH